VHRRFKQNRIRRYAEFGVLNMYAVILSGGKQHRVAEGQVLRLEKLEAATVRGRCFAEGR
jgi:hypothetical protein